MTPSSSLNLTIAEARLNLRSAAAAYSIATSTYRASERSSADAAEWNAAGDVLTRAMGALFGARMRARGRRQARRVYLRGITR